MGSDASAAEVGLLWSQTPFQSDGELVLPPRDGGGVGLVLVDVSNGFCTVGAGNLVTKPPTLLFPTAVARPFLSVFPFLPLPLFIG